VPNIPRIFRGRHAARLPLLLAGTLTAASLSLASLAGPAYAHVEEVSTKSGGPKIKVGLQSREAQYYWEGSHKYEGLDKSGSANNAAASFGNASGNEVVHTANTYVIYWDPQDYYHGDWQSLIDGFMTNVGTAGSGLSKVFAVDTQYTDKTNKPAASFSSFHGAYTDTHAYPATNGCTDPRSFEPFGVPLLEGTTTPVCVTAAQVQTELERFLKQHEEEHNPLPKGMGTIFYLLTPPGVTVCLNEGGGQEARCSDFKGTPIEISRYEEGQKRFPEEEEIYATELAAYNTAITKYHEEVTEYTKAVTKYNEEVVTYEEELEIYKENKEKDKTEKKRDTETEPTKPVAPTAPVEPKAPFQPKHPTEPEGYKTYKQSFCSYHAVTGSGSNAILYAAIPWTAGGDGDYHLTLSDQTGGFACQDGGFEPHESIKQNPEFESKEREPSETAEARYDFEVKAQGEKEPAEVEKEQDTTKPVDQEPNQLGSARSSDGSYDKGLADLIINQIAVEQQDIVTDPLLNGWQDSVGNEVTDECRNFFAGAAGGGGANGDTLAGALANESLGGSYYLNSGYSLAGVDNLKHTGVEYPGLPYPAAGPCPNGVVLEPKFTAPNTVKGGEVVGFDGMESDISLNSAIGFSAAGKPQPNYATYKWNFGDGTPEVSGYAPGAPACEAPWLSTCAASEFHSYKYSGTYNVTLTVKDVGGNEAAVTNPITVVEGEARPEEKGSGGSGGGSGSGSSTGSSAATAGSSGSSGSGSSGSGSAPSGTVTPAKPIPGPVASAAVVSRSLASVLKKGLVISYSVNEQVAGQFQVLLASSLAKRIGLHGPAATGLAPGSAPSIVIGKAILVTTRGGRNTVKILFGKQTAAKLRKLGSVPLTIRLIVRNASSHSPLSTTVISTVTLSR
jgi:hypothetical protein